MLAARRDSVPVSPNLLTATMLDVHIETKAIARIHFMNNGATTTSTRSVTAINPGAAFSAAAVWRASGTLLHAETFIIIRLHSEERRGEGLLRAVFIFIFFIGLAELLPQLA